MDKKKLMDELNLEFDKMKTELKIKPTLNEMDEIFYIKDFILQSGYVSDSLSRMICRRIVDTFGSWSNYLHGLIVPMPQNLINVTESGMFSETEKDEIIKLINRILAHISGNSLIGITKDKKSEGKFIDDSISLWNDYVKPELGKIMEKVNSGWVEKIK